MTPTKQNRLNWFKNNKEFYKQQQRKKEITGYHNKESSTLRLSRVKSDYEQAKEQHNKMFSFYVGSNNLTHKLEIDKLENLLKVLVNGYSIQIIKGCWEGQKEDTAKVDIVTDALNIKLIAETIKKHLKQKSIMVTVTKPQILFI